ncbi:MAG TPA: TfoX/Sxy family protein [Thermoplasmata archaeon]|nr:TfoX/Sxy family protein [Thermoplasmata archaeon]
MKIPPPSAMAVQRFEECTSRLDHIEVRKVFGQPSAFVGGNMFFGVFGDRLFLRLSEPDRIEIRSRHGAATFEPMAGRPMSEYVTIPVSLLAEKDLLIAWIERSRSFVDHLPAKPAKPRARSSKSGPRKARG